jgi:hypothetical protein
MTTRLPVLLENLRIATPCNADWDDMAGDERVRFCGLCEKNVYNLSAMSRADAEALVRAREGRMCIRMYQRSDGTVLTSDCPEGVRREKLRHRIRARIAAMTASAALVIGLITGRARADLAVDGKKPTPPPTNVHVGHVMGGAVARPPEPVKMGKVAIKQPDPPKPMMGEPRPMMGDVAVANDKQ